MGIFLKSPNKNVFCCLLYVPGIVLATEKIIVNKTVLALMVFIVS